MEYEDRPKLHALVASMCPPFGLMSAIKLMPLEEAVKYAELGWVVLVDPSDERDLAMWERMERACQPKQKWFEQS